MLTKENIQEMYPLSPMQENMFFHALLSPDSQAYFEQMAYRIKGELDPILVEKSLRKLIARHDVLRTVFVQKTLERPIQVVLKNVEADFTFKDVSQSPEADLLIEEYKKKDRNATFDLGKDRLMRVAIFNIGPAESEFIWSFHHIIMDGWCLGILHTEFMQIYTSLVKGEEPQLPKAKPFLSYIKWLDQQDTEAHAQYWKNYLEGITESSGIPAVLLSDPQKDEYRNEEFRFSLTRSQSKALKDLAKEYAVSLNVLLQSLWAVLVSKYSAQDDIVFGTVVSGRPPEIGGVESIVGLFINTIPVRYQISGNTVLTDLVRKASQDQAEGQDYQYGSLVDIMSETALKSNLIDHLFVFENYPLQDRLNENSGSESDFQIVDFESFDQTGYNLNVMVFPGETIDIKFRYNAFVYSQGFITQLAGHLGALADKALRNMHVSVKELNLMSAKEIEKVAIGFNATDALPAANISVKELLEEQVTLSPDNPALYYEGESFSYRELNEEVNRLANFLLTEGKLKPGNMAAVVLHRSQFSVITMLALSKIGVCYVPLSSDLPLSLMETLLEQTKAEMIFTEKKLQDTYDFSAFDVLEVDQIDLSDQSPANPDHQNALDQPLYVIYTSGTSGIPKGVVQTHSTLSNLIRWQKKYSGIEKGLKMLQYTAFTFDVSLQDVFFSLSSGGCLYILPEIVRLDFAGIWDFIFKQGIELVSFPTTVLTNLFREESGFQSKTGSLKHLVTAGEQLVLNDNLRKFLRENATVKLHNHYGPSETHVVTTFTFDGFFAEKPDRVPIGKPVSNNRVYLLDERLKPVPIGVAGEIYVAGAHIALGYLNQRDLTEQKFLDPFLPWESERLYRTGDMGKWLESGDIQFLGRKDRQVKVKGNRIELKEIEIALKKHESVSEAIVLVNQDATGENFLAAYVIGNRDLDQQDYKLILKEKLPSYMMPDYFVKIDQVPLTKNGKIDENALREIPLTKISETLELPSGKEEETLAALWKKILPVEVIGRNDDFFEIGGHSLRAARLLAHISKEFKVRIALKDIFNNPTIATMANLITREETGEYEAIPVAREESDYELSHAQRRIWLIQQAGGAETAYNMSVSYQLQGDLNQEALEQALERTIKRHEILRTVFPIQDGVPRQEIIPYEGLKFKVTRQDLSHLEKPFETAMNLIRKEGSIPFDLTRGPLVRVTLLTTNPQQHVLVMTLHHIIFDGWSVNIFFNEVAEYYNLIRRGNTKAKSPLRIQYKDYAVWHNAKLADKGAETHKNFWIETFRQKIHPLNLPLDFERPPVLSYEGKSISRSLTRQQSEQIRLFARERELSVFMVLLSIIKSWVYLMTGQEDVVIGSPVAGRDHVDLEDQMGFYSNTLPLRSRFSCDWKFEKLVRKVAENTFDAYQHQQYPLDLMIEDLGLKNQRNRSPLFDILFILQNNETEFAGLDGVEITNFSSGRGAGLYDLLLSMQEHDEKLHIDFVFNTSLFTEDTASLLLEHLIEIAQLAVKRPDCTISELDRCLPSAQPEEGSCPVLNSLGKPAAINTVGKLSSGEKARLRKDGSVEVIGFRPEGYVFEGQYFTAAEIEGKILANPFVNEVRLVNLQGDAKRHFPCAHIVYNDFPEESLLKESIAGDLPAGFVETIGFSNLDYIVTNEDGLPDPEKLREIVPLNSKTLKILEDHIRRLEGVEAVAGYLSNRYRDQGRIKIHELFPEADFVSSKDKGILSANQLSSAAESEYPEVSDDDSLALSIGKEFEVPEDGCPGNLVEALMATAEKFPDKEIVFIDRDQKKNHISYYDLLHQARCLLNGFQQNGLKPGDSIIIQVENVIDYLSSFWAAVLGGIVPVTVSKAVSNAKTDAVSKKLLGIWSLLEKPMILTDISGKQATEYYRDSLLTDRFDFLAISEIRTFGPAEKIHNPKPEDVVLFQLSSGSTGMSKCIQQTHKALILHIHASQQYNGYRSEDVTLNWLPFDHVVPLVTFHIKDVFLGKQQVHVATSVILDNPLLWLDYLEEYSVTHSWAPNFGYKLVAERLQQSPGKFWDLGNLKFLLNAGEQVTLAAIKDFLDAVKDFGVAERVMQPSFGMAEVCTCMTYNNTFDLSDIRRYRKGSAKMLVPAAENEQGITFIDLGPPVAGVSIRITDENNEILPENCIGRFQIKSPSVTPGYLKNPDANEQAFVGEGWFNSGDLGFIADGRLYITGREKEEIIIRGVNYHCHDIEEIVSQVEGVEPTYVACTSLADESSGTESLQIFFSPGETVSGALLSAIMKEVTQNIGLAPGAILPIPKLEFPKTTSGKIQRTRLRQMLEDGLFEEETKAMNALLRDFRKSVPQWFYQRIWKPKQKWSYTENNFPKHIVVFGESDLLSLQGIEGVCLISVMPGEKFSRIGDGHFTIRPDQLEDYQSLADQLRKENRLPQLVLHAWNYNEAVYSRDETGLLEAQKSGVFSLLRFLQVWDGFQEKSLRLVVLTSDAKQVLPDEKVEVFKTSMQGFLNSASEEMSWLKCCQLDIPFGSRDLDKFLAIELSVPYSAETEVAYREGKRLVNTLKRVTLTDKTINSGSVCFRERGMYLITGGLGGVGEKIAQYLIQNYDVSLLITGRTDLGEVSKQKESPDHNPDLSRKIDRLEKIKALGNPVVYGAVDVLDQERMNDFLRHNEEKWGKKLDGIIHLAGDIENVVNHWKNLERHLIKGLEPADLFNTLRSKAWGTYQVAQLLRDRPQAKLINFSSVNSHFGGYSFAAYSAASSLQDYILPDAASDRQTHNLNWSMWDDLGINRGNEFKELTVNKGFASITSEEGVNSLEIALRMEMSQVFIGLDGSKSPLLRLTDADKYASRALEIAYTTTNKLNPEEAILKEVGKFHLNIPVELFSVEKMPVHEDGRIDEARLRQITASRKNSLQNHKASTSEEKGLIKIWEEVLGISGIGINDNLFELGGDSLNAMLITSRVYQKFKISLGMHELFMNPSVGQLAKVLLQKVEEEKQELLPLPANHTSLASRAEDRLWFLSKIEETKAAYNVYSAYTIRGELDTSALDRAFKQLVARHESLRTFFQFREGQLYRQIHPELLGFSIAYSDLSRETNKENLLKHLVEQARIVIFDLEKGPLLQVQLVRTEEDVHVLLITLHHIVWDAASEKILLKELLQVYQAEVQGLRFPLSPLEIQYKDYVGWQQKNMESKEFALDEAYWKKQLKGLPLLNFPTEYARPAVKSYAGDRQFFEISRKQSDFVFTLAKARGMSIFMILLATVKALIYRYTLQDDFAVGTPISGRNHVKLEQQLGLFLNTLVLRTAFNGEADFLDLLDHVKKTTTEAYKHQNYPFDLIVDKLYEGRDASRSPLFDILVTMQPSGEGDEELEIPGITFEPLVAEFLYSKFDLTFSFKETGGHISAIVEYNTDLFGFERISRLIGHFKGILDAVLKDRRKPLNQLDFLPAAEKDRLIRRLNDTQIFYPGDCNINDLVERQVKKNPESLALVYDEFTFTYSQLDQMVSKLAAYLQKSHMIKAGDRIAVILDRSHASVISMLAVFRIGACYVPLDSKFPQKRVDLILNDVKPKVVLSQSDLERDITIKQSVNLDLLDLSTIKYTNATPGISPEDASYIIYTSGSTGIPKGVMQTYGMLSNLIQWDLNDSGLTGGNLLQYSSFSFDSSLHDVLYTLSAGGCVHIVGERMKLELNSLADYITNQNINILSMPFAALNWLMSYQEFVSLEKHSLKHIISTGEQLLISSNMEEFLKQNPDVLLHNFYGPSETHVVTAYTLSGADDKISGRPPIGKPLANTSIYLLDKYYNLLPEGIPGEIYIGGANLAIGYLNNREATDSRFKTVKIEGEDVQLYDSGDLGYWTEQGEIIYLGRKDKQLKINGYRIEPGEVAHYLTKHEQIARAVVTVRKDRSGTDQLVAYLIAGNEITIPEIKQYLSGHLPKYMVPNFIIKMDEFETTTAGKIDENALPDPFVRDVGEIDAFTVPTSKTANEIWLVWKRLLGIEEISIYDNFFDIGGNSMKLIHLNYELNKLFPGKINITDLFKFTSIDSLASFIDVEEEDVPDSIEL